MLTDKVQCFSVPAFLFLLHKTKWTLHGHLFFQKRHCCNKCGFKIENSSQGFNAFTTNYNIYGIFLVILYKSSLKNKTK